MWLLLHTWGMLLHALSMASWAAAGAVMFAVLNGHAEGLALFQAGEGDAWVDAVYEARQAWTLGQAAAGISMAELLHHSEERRERTNEGYISSLSHGRKAYKSIYKGYAGTRALSASRPHKSTYSEQI